jgi:hypothetical protein
MMHNCLSTLPGTTVSTRDTSAIDKQIGWLRTLIEQAPHFVVVPFRFRQM